MNFERTLNHKLYTSRETTTRHLDYEREFRFYKAIASGNIPQVNEGLAHWEATNAFENSEEKNGVLSKNPLQNRKYHFVVLTAMMTRFCVDAGLNQEIAYSMSDIFIQQADECTSIDQVNQLTKTAVMEFTLRMRDEKKKNIYSKQIVRCIDYIYDNLNQNLHVDVIAKHVQMTPSYLSRLFSREVGISISAYIKNLRLDTAAQMLIYSDYEISEIAAYFLFSSQSHFTTAFQKKYGITPKRYRDENMNASMPVS